MSEHVTAYVAEAPHHELPPGRLLSALISALEHEDPSCDLIADPGCGRREGEDGVTWYPLVIGRVGAVSWYMRPATARALAVLMAHSWRLRAHFENVPGAASVFTEAADEAERLAAEATKTGRAPSNQHKELH